MVNGSVENEIEGGLIQEDQRYQKAFGKCTLLKFNIFSSQAYQQLTMIPVVNPPYIRNNMSSRAITLQFPFCISCPIGFEKHIDKVTGCNCICDTYLKPYIINCSVLSEIVTKGHTTAWIGYIKSKKNLSSYLIYPYCPFDYCLPPNAIVDINFNIPNGVNTQCAHNRSGTLCGSCEQGLSISLGSSKCIPCPTNWQGLLVTVIAGELLAGLLLIFFILSLNLTVAVGTLNGIIFYANIIAANSSAFFPSTSFLTIFIAWINLELGIDTCFFENMDAYWKVWIELAFPTFIIVLVVMIIVTSERFVTVAQLVGKRNPVATLDTLILLSYMKFLRIIIASFSFAILNYPDNSYKIVWLIDATIPYFSGKCIALMIAATIILMFGIAYTALLFFWQWLLQYQRKKIFKWVRHQKLCLFLEPYHAPYNFKHRYWTGLLLLIRVILYAISAANQSADPGVNILATGILVSGLLLFKGLLRNNNGIYKKWPVEVLEIMCYINIVWFCLARYYVMETRRDEFVVSCLSVSIMFILFLTVIAYHLIIETFIKTNLCTKIKKFTWQFRRAIVNDRDGLTTNLLESNENSLAIFSEVESPTHTEVCLSALIQDSYEGESIREEEPEKSQEPLMLEKLYQKNQTSKTSIL